MISDECPFTNATCLTVDGGLSVLLQHAVRMHRATHVLRGDPTRYNFGKTYCQSPMGDDVLPSFTFELSQVAPLFISISVGRALY
ncbi:hypothetical protein ASC90_03785 [Rhizobium sp. Root1220]|nr:hypothetical protein ASC90_03785 [Rhizobium sp. Root1220]